MAGFKKWATNDVLTATDFNTYVASQVVYQFATTAARDAAITGANLVDGMCCYISSGDSGEGLYTYNGTSWRKGPGWNAPWGVRSVKADTTDRTSTTASMVELTTNLRTTETYIANRYLKFTLEASLSETSTGSGFVAEIYNTTAAGVVRRIAQRNTTVGTGYQISNSVIGVSASGAVYTVRFQGVTNTVNILGATVQSTRLIVEDIGPSGNPL